MTPVTRVQISLSLACLCALAATPARAEIGETTGTDQIINTVGPSWGNSVARMHFSVNSGTNYQHDAEVQSSLRSASWSTPSVRLFGQTITPWEAIGDSLIVRHRTDPNAMGTGATGRLVIDGTTLYDCFQLAVRDRSDCMATRSLSRSFLHSGAEFVIGVIPVGVSGSISGNVSGTVRGNASMRPFSLNVAGGAEDTTLGVVSMDGSLVGRGFFGVGAEDVAHVGIEAELEFVRVVGAPRATGSRIVCREGAAGCSRDRRVRYGMESILSASRLGTLGGRLWVEACLFNAICHEETLVSWRGLQLGGAPPIYQQTRSEQFSSRY